MTVVYIHGHGASSASFNFLRQSIGGDSFALEYDSHFGFSNNLAQMVEQLAEIDDDIFFVAHSLGGLYALHLAAMLGNRVTGGVTMATPYGGSKAALFLNLVFPQQLYRDIHPTALPVIHGVDIDLGALPWTVIVSTLGNSQLIAAANDGVVTQASMRSRRGAIFVDVASNHHEVTQSRHSLAIIQQAIAAINHQEEIHAR